MTMPEVTTYTEILPVPFEAAAVNPTAFGLYTSTLWIEIGADQPSRHLTGVEVRGPNYGVGLVCAAAGRPVRAQGGRAPGNPGPVRADDHLGC